MNDWAKNRQGHAFYIFKCIIHRYIHILTNSIYVYIYIYIYIYTCIIYIYTYARVLTICRHVGGLAGDFGLWPCRFLRALFLHVYLCVWVCVHVYACVYMYERAYVYVFACSYVCCM